MEPHEDRLPPVIPPTEPTDLSVAPAQAEPSPWGFWATLGFLVPILGAYFVAQVPAVAIYFALAWPDRPDLTTLENNGFFLAIAALCSAPVAIGICLSLAAMRKGCRLRDYFGLYWPSASRAFRWGSALGALVFATDFVTTQWLHRPLVPEVMIDAYRTAKVLPLFWFAIIVAAPCAEEFVFRGFLFRGMFGSGDSNLRIASAIIVPSIFWSALHLQYDSYGMFVIFLSGLLLGVARMKSGSLLLCIALHALMNLIATIEIEILLRLA